MTAGMAARSPAAVLINASEIPGATVAKSAEPWSPISRKASMIPQTVPKRPMKGVTVAVVAKKVILLSRLSTPSLRRCVTSRSMMSRLILFSS